MTLFQQRNDLINNWHVFSKDSTIINICENDAVLPKEDTLINLTLDKVTSDKPFTELLEPVVASLLKAIKALVKFEYVSVPVPIRDINWINACRKLHVSRYIQICLRKCNNKVDAFQFKTMNLGINKQKSNTSPCNKRSICVPVVLTLNLLISMST